MLDFFLSIVGFAFFLRIFFRTNVLIVLLIAIFFLHPLFIGIFLLTLILFIKVFEFYRKRELENSLILLLDLIILSMKSGRSLKFSVDEVTSKWHQSYQRKIFTEKIKIFENPPPSRSSELTDLVFSEVSEIKKNNSAHLEQTILLRKHLKIILNLRRRSGQSSQQAKAQAIIIFLLYFCLLGFMSSSFGWKKVETFFVTTFPILFLGVFFVFYISRRFKWKI